MNKIIIKTISLTVAILIILITFGCINTEEENLNNRYTINLSDEWKQIEPYSNYDAIYTPDINSNIYFYITLPENLDIGNSIITIANQIIQREENKHSSFTLISNKNIDIKTVSAHEIIYTFKEKNIDYKAKHVPIKDKDVLYELIYIAPENQYENYISSINQAIYSFRPT